jgi:hypothetical protein
VLYQLSYVGNPPTVAALRQASAGFGLRFELGERPAELPAQLLDLDQDGQETLVSELPERVTLALEELV